MTDAKRDLERICDEVKRAKEAKAYKQTHRISYADLAEMFNTTVNLIKRVQI